MSDATHDPRLNRVLREAATPGLMTALAERLAPTDLQTLLLEVSRRRALLHEDARSRRRVRLGSIHRVIRAQAFSGPGMTAHFKLLALCTAGRDEGSFDFEAQTLTEHIHLLLDVLERSRRVGRTRVTITDLAEQRRTALRTRVLEPLSQGHPGTAFGFDQERTTGRGYYTGACFEVHANGPDGELNIADGGFTTWTADLLSNAKERLLISGLGIERLCGLFPSG